MPVTMDILMFLHLWVYPIVTGSLLTNAVWAAVLSRPSRTRFTLPMWLFVVLSWAALGMFLLSVEAHINYQGYLQ